MDEPLNLHQSGSLSMLLFFNFFYFLFFLSSLPFISQPVKAHIRLSMSLVLPAGSFYSEKDFLLYHCHVLSDHHVIRILSLML